MNRKKKGFAGVQFTVKCDAFKATSYSAVSVVIWNSEGGGLYQKECGWMAQSCELKHCYTSLQGNNKNRDLHCDIQKPLQVLCSIRSTIIVSLAIFNE